jgi:hypothetical protein
LLTEISLAKYVILRKQVFNQIVWETLMESMLNIYKRMDQNDLGMVNNTIQSYIWKVRNCSLGAHHILLFNIHLNDQSIVK